MAMHDQEVELFGEALDDEVLGDELDALVAEEEAKEIGDLEPQAPISSADAAKYREENGIEEPQQQEAEEEAEAPKRRLVAA